MVLALCGRGLVIPVRLYLCYFRGALSVSLEPKPAINYLASALGSCPICTKGKLFRGLLTVRDSCDVCGTDFKATQTGDGPVVFVILIVGAIVCTGIMVADFSYHLPMALNLAVFLPMGALLSLGLMRPLKGLMIAAQLKYKVKD